jgi:hypothetical protein
MCSQILEKHKKADENVEEFAPIEITPTKVHYAIYTYMFTHTFSFCRLAMRLFCVD